MFRMESSRMAYLHEFPETFGLYNHMSPSNVHSFRRETLESTHEDDKAYLDLFGRSAEARFLKNLAADECV